MLCGRCGKQTARRNRLHRYCSDCRTIIDRQQANRAAQKRLKTERASKTRVYVCTSCVRCIKAPKRGPLPRACAECTRDAVRLNYWHYTCKDCGGRFSRESGTGRMRIRCEACRKEFHARQEKSRWRERPPVARQCVACNKTFAAKNKRARYCSHKCVASLRFGHRPKCQSCGNTVSSRLAKQCRSCYLASRKDLFVEIKCNHCGRFAKKRRWNSKTPRYCSRECFFASIKAETTEEQRKERREYARKYGSTKHRRRCKKFGGFYNPKVTRLAVLRAGLWRCYICGTKVSDDLPANHKRKATIDHIVPLEKGGPHDWHNVKACCRRCNTKKQAQWDGQNVFNFSSGWEYVNG